MKKIALFILLGALHTVVFAHELHVAGALPAASLSCPQGPVRVSSNRSSTPSTEIPDPKDINAALAASPATSATSIPLVFQPLQHQKIALWGDSHAAANIFSSALIQALGLSEKRTLPSFIPPTMGNKNVRLPLQQSCQSTGWKTELAYLNRDSTKTWSRALSRLTSNQQGEFLWLDFRSTLLTDTFHSLDIALSSGPGDLRVFDPPSTSDTAPPAPTVLRLSVNGDDDQVIELNPATDNTLRITAQNPIATLKITLVAGSVGIDGFLPHYDSAPDYVFDTLGIPGATAKGLQFLETSTAGQYDLILVEFGTNEGNNSAFDAQRYEADLQQSLSILRRAYPQADCVLIGPTDRGLRVAYPATKKKCKGKKCKTAKKPKVDLLRYAKIHAAITDSQQRVGKNFQCHSWSWQNAMGGLGGIYRWQSRSPALAQRDLIHLTAEGYRLSARLFAQQLMQETIQDDPQQP